MAEPLGVFYGSGVSMWLNHLGLIWYQSGLGVVAEPLMMGFIFPIGFENCEEIKM